MASKEFEAFMRGPYPAGSTVAKLLKEHERRLECLHEDVDYLRRRVTEGEGCVKPYRQACLRQDVKKRNATIQSLNHDLEKREAQIAALEYDLNSLRRIRDSQADIIRKDTELKTKNADLRKRNQRQEAMLKELDRERFELEKEVRELKKDVKCREEEIYSLNQMAKEAGPGWVPKARHQQMVDDYDRVIEDYQRELRERPSRGTQEDLDRVTRDLADATQELRELKSRGFWTKLGDLMGWA